MSGYVLSRRAERDLQGIWQFSAKRWSAARADGYIAEITAALQQLADGLRPSQTVEVLGTTYQRIFAGSHVIFCRQPTAASLRVVRILHQSMDSPRHLT